MSVRTSPRRCRLLPSIPPTHRSRDSGHGLRSSAWNGIPFCASTAMTRHSGMYRNAGKFLSAPTSSPSRGGRRNSPTAHPGLESISCAYRRKGRAGITSSPSSHTAGGPPTSRPSRLIPKRESTSCSIRSAMRRVTEPRCCSRLRSTGECWFPSSATA